MTEMDSNDVRDYDDVQKLFDYYKSKLVLDKDSDEIVFRLDATEPEGSKPLIFARAEVFFNIQYELELLVDKAAIGLMKLIGHKHGSKFAEFISNLAVRVGNTVKQRVSEVVEALISEDLGSLPPNIQDVLRQWVSAAVRDTAIAVAVGVIEELAKIYKDKLFDMMFLPRHSTTTLKGQSAKYPVGDNLSSTSHWKTFGYSGYQGEYRVDYRWHLY